MKTRHALLLAAAIGTSCSGSPPAAPAVDDSAFDAFVDEYFAAESAFQPTSATANGFHEYDSKLEDLSRASFESRIAQLKQFQTRLDALRQGPLSDAAAIDAEALDGQIRGELLDLDTLRLWERNPMLYTFLPGGAVNVLIKRDFAPAADRLRSVVARLEAIPALFAAARENVENPPREFTDLAVRMAGGSVGYFEAVLAPWAEQAAAGDAALLESFEAANTAVIAASREYAAWLKDDLLPRSEGDYALGEEHFLAKLRYQEMVDMPLAELLATGESQLERDYAAFVETASRIDPDKTPAEVMRSLSDEHPSAEELLPSVRGSLEEARQFLVDHDIVTIPSEVRPSVEETPAFARAGSFASMDTPGPYETKATEAFYYVTPVEKDWDAEHQEQHLRLYNPYVVAMIDVHEVWPGHYLQFLYASRFPTKTRKLVFSGTNVEGWAHYTEQMMVDEGFGGDDPKIRLAQLQEALLRDCRYVVGIKLHTAGMTVEQGAQLFQEKGFQEPANAYEEARRGAYNPTYLYYTLGKIEIQKLRDEYRERTGASLKEFHDAFVAQGGLPIPLVRKLLLNPVAAPH
jgi:uncharacterized protein (DUF885 family)